MGSPVEFTTGENTLDEPREIDGGKCKPVTSDCVVANLGVLDCVPLIPFLTTR